MRTALVTAAFCTLCLASQARADVPLEPVDWTRLQGRVTLSMPGNSPLRHDLSASMPDNFNRVSAVSVMGDYYLQPSLSQLSLTGLRATSGVMFGRRSPLWGMPSGRASALVAERRFAGHDTYNQPEHGTTPYLGIGYTGGGTSRSSSWGFSADVGLMSLAPGNIRGLSKIFNGSQNLDDMVRDLRLSPVVQVGFTYAF